jgi:hypothetical protein
MMKFKKQSAFPEVVRFCLIAVFTCFASADGATNPPALPQTLFRPGSDADTQRATEADHRRMMNLLNIQTLRRGRDGNNTNSSFYANYDESKANPYPDLPEPLVLKNGEKVTTAEMWWQQRRPEIVEDFDREIYGRAPVNLPKVNWRMTSSDLKTNDVIPVLVRKFIGQVDNDRDTNISVNIELTVGTPARATAPVPVVLQLTFNFGLLNRYRGTNGPPRGGFNPAAITWQQQVLAKGWGYATLTPTSVQADNGAGLNRGIIGLANLGQPRRPDDWGVLRAWAWGASRALDYFETDPKLDAHRVGIEGHSRYGKAALVSMAYDPRFAIAYISSSGEGGAKLSRRNWGETVENLAGSGEYHWMASNFLKYAGPLNWNDLPVDAHELIALCAPRPVFIGGGATQGDGWADTRGMFMAEAAAGPVYELLGKKDLGTNLFPPVGTALVSGDLAFRQHTQGHTDGPNWPIFLNWADRYFNPNHSQN